MRDVDYLLQLSRFGFGRHCKTATLAPANTSVDMSTKLHQMTTLARDTAQAIVAAAIQPRGVGADARMRDEIVACDTVRLVSDLDGPFLGPSGALSNFPSPDACLVLVVEQNVHWFVGVASLSQLLPYAAPHCVQAEGATLKPGA